MPKRNAKKAAKVRQYARKWKDHWKKNTAHYHEMTQFILGEQWKEEEAKLFEDYKKMPLTVNKIAPQANHMLGEQRQNTPNLQIQPTDDVDEKTAEVRAALIKEISLNAHAKIIYQTVYEQMIIGGFSGYRLFTDYEADDTFDQYIGMASFRDPTKCFWDVGAESPCKTDGMYSGFTTSISRKKFASLYGDQLEKKIGTTTSDSLETDDAPMQISDEYSITIFEIYERKSKMETLYQLSNGRSVSSKELDSMEKIELDGNELIMDNGEAVTIDNERTYPKYRVVHSKWAGDYELEKSDFHSKQLPIIFADQKSFWDKNGKQITRSFFKDAKDSQRFLNYLRTQIAYMIKVSRYDQFLVSKQNVKSNDTQAIWRDPATQQGGLIYDESPNGNKPEQLRPQELPQSIMAEYQSASQDIQVTTGLFDTQMGQQGNEVSGDAIDARVERGSYNTFVPQDSLNRAIAVGGEIIDEMIPSVYDTERSMNLEMKDTGQKKISLNKPMDEYGMQTENDMSKGKYKIRLVPGSSYEKQKTENLRSMDMVLSKQPQAFGLIGDLYVENLPMANSIEMRNRLRTIVPPEIIEAGKTGQPLPPKPPQQDPMLMLKQQELQHKMMQTQLDAQAKAHDLQLKEQDLIMRSHQAGVDYSAKLQELEIKKQENQAALQERMMSYQSEMARINADVHMGHSNNIQSILTHQPNHFKAEPPKKGQPMSETQRIDDIINGLTTEAPEKIESEPREDEAVSEDKEPSDEGQAARDEGKETEKVTKTDSKESDVVVEKEPVDTDEYGIEVPKARTYSEEEVQRMIRDRLSRGQNAQNPQQQAVQQAAQNFQLDPESSESWEAQLEGFVKNVIDKSQKEANTKQYQREEQERQTNFEVKFTTGMEKFSDFKDVVGKMPITDSMMMAIRDMDNPATFIYAASKLQPKEIERIAALTDPFQQAKEMGRLDERMRKAKAVSKTAVPLKATTSDMSSKASPKRSIDSMIQSHAKSKLKKA